MDQKAICNTKKAFWEILDPDNLNKACKKVKSNRGKPGIDGMTADELLPFLKDKGSQIRQAILEGTYCPQPVRRTEIPKPDGGVRLLGIPTVLDRVIQQDCSLIAPYLRRLYFGFCLVLDFL